MDMYLENFSYVYKVEKGVMELNAVYGFREKIVVR
jgi:hypothetical protein